MTELNMLEAKTNLTKIIRLLETNQEEEFIICRNGEPCAKLVPFSINNKKRKVGRCNGKYKVPSWEEWKKLDEETSDLMDTNIEDLNL